MAQHQIPFITVPIKHTDDVDWRQPLKRYIAHEYQEDPEKYENETLAINRLRQDMRGAGKDITGRDLLYRYFGQLELLELRFPVDEKSVKILFTWYDAFTGQPTAQHSLAYEKASIVFNIAATLSAISSSQNRADDLGQKRAFNFLQVAAGVFQYINENFLHAPSIDLSRDIIKLLSELMLVQAHECFLEKTVHEQKKSSLIAKIASHADWTYGSVANMIRDNNSVGKAWLTFCELKQKYYHAMAQEHMAATCAVEAKYGEQVARLLQAVEAAKEANKLATTLRSFLSSSSYTHGALSADSATVLQDLCKVAVARYTDLHTSAERDNNIIYHDHLAPGSILKPIERLCTAKAVPLSELYNQNDVYRIIGGDIFARLIPLNVHKSASLYSEEKAKLIREETEKCDTAKAKLQASCDYMKLPGSLSRLKQGSYGSRSIDELAMPSAASCAIADEVAKEESSESSPIQELKSILPSQRDHVETMLNEVSLLLDQETKACETQRVKFGDQWTQQPLGSLTSDFRHDIRNHRQGLETAGASDSESHRRYHAVKKEIDVLKQGSKSTALEELYAATMSDASNVGASKSGQSLMDDGDTDTHSMESNVARVQSILDKLYTIDKDRTHMLASFKDKVQQDDISHLLILNKKEAHAEQHIFNKEIEKFRSFQRQIETLNTQQESMTLELAQAFKTLADDPSVQGIWKAWDSAEQHQRQLEDQLQVARNEYFAAKQGVRNGIQFYTDLGDVVQSLLNNAKAFVQQRAAEREALTQQLLQQRSQADRPDPRPSLEKHPSFSSDGLSDRMAQWTLQDSTPSQPPPPVASRVMDGPVSRPIANEPAHASYPVHSYMPSAPSHGPVPGASPYPPFPPTHHYQQQYQQQQQQQPLPQQPMPQQSMPHQAMPQQPMPQQPMPQQPPSPAVPISSARPLPRPTPPKPLEYMSRPPIPSPMPMHQHPPHSPISPSGHHNFYRPALQIDPSPMPPTHAAPRPPPPGPSPYSYHPQPPSGVYPNDPSQPKMHPAAWQPPPSMPPATPSGYYPPSTYGSSHGGSLLD